MKEKIRDSLLMAATLLAPVLLVGALCSISIIGAGEVGVERLFGKVRDNHLSPGFHFLNPFSKVTKLNSRTQHEEEDSEIPTKEMLIMRLKTSLNYHIAPAKAVEIYKTIGEKYFLNFVEPHLRSTIREITGGLNANDLFSIKRDSIATQIKERMIDKIGARGFIIEDVMLKEITPPLALSQAIERKQEQQQEAEAMKFKLQREKLESERKQIEAEGIQKFQEIVKRGIDENLLRWKGIEATETLAKSPNSKIIIIGNKDSAGLPIIIGKE